MSRVEARAIASIADPDVRAVITVLRDAGQPVSEACLAEEVIARVTDEATADVSGRGSRGHQILLFHRTLPRLESLGLIEWDAERGTVDLDDTSFLDSLGVEISQLEVEQTVPWEALATVLAAPRRKRILEALAAMGPSTFPALLEAVAVRRLGVPVAEVPTEELAETEVTLYHVDLPKLAEVGLLAEGWRDGPIELCEDRLAGLTDYVAIEPDGADGTG